MMDWLWDSPQYKLLEEYLPHPSDLTALLPWAGIGAAAVLVAVFLRKGWVSHLGGMFAGAGLAAAMVLTYQKIEGLPGDWRPITATHRMLYAVCAAALVGAICDAFRNVPTVCRPLQLAAAAAVVMWPLEPFLAPDHAYHVSSTTVALFVGAVVLLGSAVEDLTRRHRGPMVPLAMCMALGAVGQMCAVAGTAIMANLAGAASLALGALALVTWWLPGRTIPAATAGAFAAVAGGSVVVMYGNADPLPPLLPFAAAAGAPMLLWLLKLPKVRDLKPVLRTLIALVLLGTTMGWAMYDLLTAIVESNAGVDPMEQMMEEMYK